MRTSLTSLVDAKLALAPVAIATDTTTKGLDVDLFNANNEHPRSTLVVISSGVVTDGTYVLKVQHSDTTTDGDYVDVPVDQLLGGAQPANLTGTTDATTRQVEYIGTKRYLRVTIASTSTTSGGLFTAVALRGFPRRRPITH